jgi:hypothetical protein
VSLWNLAAAVLASIVGWFSWSTESSLSLLLDLSAATLVVFSIEHLVGILRGEYKQMSTKLALAILGFNLLLAIREIAKPEADMLRLSMSALAVFAMGAVIVAILLKSNRQVAK